MSSRLDRLFILLETGSSPATRRAAAIQLGEVQKTCPGELFNLLSRLHNYLGSPSWDTRLAAVQGIEHILKNVPIWQPELVKVECDNVESKPMKDEEDQYLVKLEEEDEKDYLSNRLSFSNFSIGKILSEGESLLAREGSDLVRSKAAAGLGKADRLAQQRKNIDQKLGLEGAAHLGLDSNELFSNEDLEDASEEADGGHGQVKRRKMEDILKDENLSARQRNRLKRKARWEASVGRPGGGGNGSSSSHDVAEVKAEADSTTGEGKSGQLLFATETQGGLAWQENLRWPFELYCQQLSKDIFGSRWEQRHGAVTALRQLLRLHGKTGGMRAFTSAEHNLELHRSWLVDLTLRLISLIALDKFGDFVSDQVVAPVRESGAQALGAALQMMEADDLREAALLLLQLVDEKDWEVRHGGLLGLKYLLAVRGEAVDARLLAQLFPPVHAGLTDSSDDVIAVAASALLPVVPLLIERLPSGQVGRLAATLWAALLDLDDLTCSSHAILVLLSDLLSSPGGLEQTLVGSGGGASAEQQLVELVPRLFPFLSHSSSVVRRASLQALIILTGPRTGALWLPTCILVVLRQVYQRALLENHEACLQLIPRLWDATCEQTPLSPLLMASCPWFGPWITLIAGPAHLPLDPAVLLPPHVCPDEDDQPGQEAHKPQFLGGPEAVSAADPLERNRCVARARNLAARLLGKLASFIMKPMPGILYTPAMESPLDMLLSKALVPQLTTCSGYQKLAISILVIQWLELPGAPDCLDRTALPGALLNCLTTSWQFMEVAAHRARAIAAGQDYLALLRHHCKASAELIPQQQPSCPEELEQLLGDLTERLLAGEKSVKGRALESLLDRRSNLVNQLAAFRTEQTSLERLVMAALAGALAHIGAAALPDKLNPVIRPLMEAVKGETNEEFQEMAARSLVLVVRWCLDRPLSPADKVVKNICSLACSRTEDAPPVDLAHLPRGESTTGNLTPHEGILSLVLSERKAEKKAQRPRAKEKSKKKKEGSKIGNIEEQIELDGNISQQEEELAARLEIQNRGACHVLRHLAKHFGQELFLNVPKLKEVCIQPILTNQAAEPHVLVMALRVLAVIAPFLSEQLHPLLMQLVPQVLGLSIHETTAVRYVAAQAVAALARQLTVDVIAAVMEFLLPHLHDHDNDVARQGAVETLFCLVEELGLDIVPFIVLLIVPTLGRMSDANESVRQASTSTFAALVRLMPLEGGAAAPEPLNMPESLRLRKENEKAFLAQLMDAKRAEPFPLSVPVSAQLRSYQAAGVNWLAFLNRYGLHGILCDDMGLGKTLQTICMLACDHHQPAVAAQSLVVCPTTLGGHWLEEVGRFVGAQYLSPFLYYGSPTVRMTLRPQLAKHNLIITSYDILRSDADYLSAINWNYVVLDEGHVIKNSKSKTFQAVRRLSAHHRLVLSGTPIQNSVTELWALFDFLLPGFLGTERQFHRRFARPILQSREAGRGGSSGAADQEAGVLALEALHRQTLPFILRRMKEDVLADLPPKITQDYVCELSPLQVKLYEDFAKARSKDLSGEISETAPGSAPTHVFQALQYLKKVCNHPRLVLSADHPDYAQLLHSHLQGAPDNLLNIAHSGKLVALKQLLIDLGLERDSESVVTQHRVLIFCQLKAMLDIVEQDLLKIHLPGLSYLRLDGSVPAASRHSLVSRFNADPSIDLLLLTTSVGGLGLNLTGADTVIFVEHDWNPMKDLQAMDRAHRIGQRRVVNVFRLITQHTLEEKIMSLQRFKLHTARTVISTDNASMQTMATDQVLDLFSLRRSEAEERSGGASKADSDAGSGVSAVLQSLPELWDEAQYAEEYDLSLYIASLRGDRA